MSKYNNEELINDKTYMIFDELFANKSELIKIIFNYWFGMLYVQTIKVGTIDNAIEAALKTQKRDKKELDEKVKYATFSTEEKIIFDRKKIDI